MILHAGCTVVFSNKSINSSFVVVLLLCSFWFTIQTNMKMERSFFMLFAYIVVGNTVQQHTVNPLVCYQVLSVTIHVRGV